MAVVVAAILVLLAGIAGGVWLTRGKQPVPRESKAGNETPRPAPGEKEPLPEREKDKDNGKVGVKPAPAPRLDPEVEGLLATINRQREEAGVEPLSVHDEHSKGCKEHAAFLVRHLAKFSDIDVHDQDPSLAGGTPAGKQAAAAASVVRKPPQEALRAWLLAPVHRALILRPELRSAGIGFASDGKGGWVSVFDWQRGEKAAPARRRLNDPVVYPVPRQGNVPLVFPGNEIPDPLPMTQDKVAGFPITATFPRGVNVPDARASLEDEAGDPVEVWFSSPTKPANEKFASLQQNTICLFAKKPLRPGERYAVRMEATLSGRGSRGDWSPVWTFTTQPPAELGRNVYERALGRLNHFRKAAGLEPVAFDPELSRACAAHAGYVARHLDRVPERDAYNEKPDLPGYTEEGAKVGKGAIIRTGGGVGPRDAIDWMLASVLNRHLVLNPGMKTAGLGAALHSPRGWIWVISLSRTGGGSAPLAVLYPGKDQTEVPLHFGRELSSLIKDQPADAPAGFAVTANFPARDRVRNVSARLADAAGNEVPAWISTPEAALQGTGGYRQIVLVPKAPLAPAATYEATMEAEVNGKAWSEKWKFTTADPAKETARVRARLLARVNDVRALAGLAPVEEDEKISRGCQAHADYVVRNFRHPRVQGLGIHDEDPKLPGATPEGAKAGKEGVIALIPDPSDSVDGWMATLYHRLPLLDPNLKRIGYGQSLQPQKGWVTVMDVGSR